MSFALAHKTWRDFRVLWLILTLAIILLETVFVGVIANFAKEFEYMQRQMPIFQQVARMLLGADLGGEITPMALVTIGFAHPVLFACNWVFLLSISTKTIAGEIDAGTIDLIATLPVSRLRMFASLSAVWILAGIPISLAPVLGAWIGTRVFAIPAPLQLGNFLLLSVHLYTVYLCVGAVGMFVSAVVSRRGPAIGVLLGWLLASFLLNFLAQIWSAVEPIDFLFLLHYYRPLPVVRTGALIPGDLVVLLVVAAVFWTAGAIRFQGRDIPAT
ncbi:MAG: hypothetical protein ACE5E5_08180 [Phycisphaerae bacterium]